jgi:hypothetical protein
VYVAEIASLTAQAADEGGELVRRNEGLSQISLDMTGVVGHCLGSLLGEGAQPSFEGLPVLGRPVVTAEGGVPSIGAAIYA